MRRERGLEACDGHRFIRANKSEPEPRASLAHGQLIVRVKGQ
jgi:hypothetical protein